MRLKELQDIEQGELILLDFDEKRQIFIRGSYVYQTNDIYILDADDKSVVAKVNRHTCVMVD